MTYIFESENHFTICAVQICRNNPEYLLHLAQVCPNHPVWPKCLQKLDTILPSYDRDWNTHQILSDFRGFIEKGCVKDHRLGMSTKFEPLRQALVEDEQLKNKPLLLELSLKLWHWLWQQKCCNTAAKMEGTMIASSSISQV